MRRLWNKFEESRIVFLVCIVIGTVYFFLFNLFTPLYADDIPYQYSFATGERIENAQDVFLSSVSHWFVRGGRIIGHALDQYLLIYDKQVFNVVNTLVFVVFVLGLYKLIGGKRISNTLLLLIFSAICFFMPRGNVILWQTVACNYFWGSAGIVLLFSVYLQSYENKGIAKKSSKPMAILKAVAMFLGGVLVGNFIEAGGAMLLAGIVLVFRLKQVAKYKIYIHEITGFIGALIGYGVLIAAPGNYLRSDTVNEMLGFDNVLISLGYRIARETYYMFVHMWWLWLAFFLLVIAVKGEKTWKTFLKENVTSLLLALLALVGVYVMTATAAYAERVLITPIIYLIVAIGKLFVKIDKERCQATIACICIFVTCGMLVSGSAALYKCRQEGVILDIRKEYITNVNEQNEGK